MSGDGQGTVIRIAGLTRRFGSITAVDGVDLDLRENEFFALLGPSGSGKTTLLRMIAGFETPDAGRIELDGADLTRVRPNRRPLNLMFQSYALFNHMSVEKNIAYGLEMERLGRDEIRRRVGDVMAMTELTELGARRPEQLSGGQRQRVALARALVKRPRVLLLDEPLGALDKQLRESMQLELKRMQHEVGITFVIVTHDQEEALVMADRIAVMRNGRIAQVDTPEALYERPASRFVAGFIGKMNFFPGRQAADGVEVDRIGLLRGDAGPGNAFGSAVSLAVRPERMSLEREPPADDRNRVAGTILDVAYHGQDLNVRIAVDGLADRVLVRLPAGAVDHSHWAPGDAVHACWEAKHSRMLGDA